MRVSVEEMNLWLIEDTNSEVNVEVKVEGDKLNVKSAAGKTFVEGLRTGALNDLNAVTLTILDEDTAEPTIDLSGITEFDSWKTSSNSVVVSADGNTATITRAYAPTTTQLIGHAKVNGTKMQKSYVITIPLIGDDVTVAAHVDGAFINSVQDY